MYIWAVEGINQRIKELIVSEGLTASTFADRIGVLRSALSHILAGRNKPGADFIEKLLLEMPYVNANWLFTGIGLMYSGKTPEPAAEMVSSGRQAGRQLDILSQLAEMFPEEYGQPEVPEPPGNLSLRQLLRIHSRPITVLIPLYLLLLQKRKLLRLFLYTTIKPLQNLNRSKTQP